MNKDALLATLIGFIVGLVITGIILLGPSLIVRLPKITLPTIALPTKSIIPTPEPESQEFTVTIDSPLADTIESTDDLLVSGTAQKGATVIIQTDADDEVIIAGDDNKYAGKVMLVEGKNVLTVTAYLENRQAKEERIVYYTPEEF